MYNIQGFYKIKSISNYSSFKEKIKRYLLSKSVKGTVILSPEGINGTIAGKKNDVNKCIEFIKNIFGIRVFDSNNFSSCTFLPFYRAKVKIKNEVVPIGLKINEKEKKKSTYIDPKKWNNFN